MWRLNQVGKVRVGGVEGMLTTKGHNLDNESGAGRAVASKKIVIAAAIANGEVLTAFVTAAAQARIEQSAAAV
jgi:hypothetical protein